jgi:ATP-dependent Lon protease
MDNQQRPRRRTTRGTGASRPHADRFQTGASPRLPFDEQDTALRALPVLPIRNAVVFPLTVTPFFIDHDKTRRAIEAAQKRDGAIFAVAQRSEEVDDPGPHDLYAVGVIAVIERTTMTPDGVLNVVLRSVRRAQVVEYLHDQPYLVATVEPLPVLVDDSTAAQARIRVAHEHFDLVARNAPRASEDAIVNVLGMTEAGQLADAIAMAIDLPLHQRQTVLETIAPLERLEIVDGLLVRELEILELESHITQNVQRELDRSQREYWLREQIRVIQRELAEHDPALRESLDLKDRILAAGMTEEAQARALREVDRLDTMPTMSPEYTVVRTYLDWLLALPWQTATTDRHDLLEAARLLEEQHFGLVKAKDRLLEFIAVRKLSPASHSPILCLVGPPGVGKTSLGRSMAQALGRKFVRLSLGGVRDEAEVRGHRRTYVGALPGRIIQTMRTAGTVNPLFVLDEIDKLASDYRGDPSSALLEVLDPEQNFAFSDHYLEVPYDLSRVIFILTANTLDPIPPALLDRMEVIELPGYSEEEKMQIARSFLIPRQLKDHGLTTTKIDLREDAVRRIVRDYTHEAGVRNLEREIGSVMRKVARRVAENRRGKVTVTAAKLPEFLGPPRGYSHEAEERDQVGVAMGVAWTSTGGDLTPVEIAVLEGHGQVVLTGRLGEVLRESAQAAISFARARASMLGLPRGFYETSDLHMHMPLGSVPKDGPSAGVPIAIALISALSGRAVRHDLAMTGEITLLGRIMPVGGVKEKLLAAHRAGIRRFVLPRRNLADLDEVPHEILEQMTIIPVDTIDDVLPIALSPAPTHAKSPALPDVAGIDREVLPLVALPISPDDKPPVSGISQPGPRPPLIGVS